MGDIDANLKAWGETTFEAQKHLIDVKAKAESTADPGLAHDTKVNSEWSSHVFGCEKMDGIL